MLDERKLDKWIQLFYKAETVDEREKCLKIIVNYFSKDLFNYINTSYRLNDFDAEIVSRDLWKQVFKVFGEKRFKNSSIFIKYIYATADDLSVSFNERREDRRSEQKREEADWLRLYSDAESACKNTKVESDEYKNFKRLANSNANFLTKRYEERLIKFICKEFSLEARESEKICSLAWGKLFRALRKGDFHQKSRVYTYLTQIAINQAKTDLKKENKAEAFKDPIDPHDSNFDESAVSYVDDEEFLSDCPLIRRIIDLCLSKLSKIERNAYIYKIQLDYSTETIASLLSCTDDAARGQYRRATDKMAVCIQAHVGDGNE